MKTSENNNSKADPNQEDMIELQNLYKLNQLDLLETKARQLLKKYSTNVHLNNIFQA